MAHPLTNVGLFAVLAAVWAPSALAWAGASTVPETTDPAPLTLQERLRATAVYDTSLTPKSFYTWTTADQVAELRGDAVLLTRTESPVHGHTKFSLSLRAHAKAGDSISKLLDTPRFARHRYAWNQPWGAAAGWDTERYGDALLRVELADEAWMGIFDLGAKQPWRFVDGEGNTVSLDQALANPDRIGVVLHISQADDDHSNGTFALFTPGFREYVLVNEGMIRHWELGTPRISDAITEAASLLRELADAFSVTKTMHVQSWNKEIRDRWRRPSTRGSVLELYEANLAFPNASYLPTSEAVRGLAELLAIEQPAPLQHTPDR